MVLIVDKPSTLLGEFILQRKLSTGIKAALSQGPMISNVIMVIKIGLNLKVKPGLRCPRLAL